MISAVDDGPVHWYRYRNQQKVLDCNANTSSSRTTNRTILKVLGDLPARLLISKSAHVAAATKAWSSRYMTMNGTLCDHSSDAEVDRYTRGTPG